MKPQTRKLQLVQLDKRLQLFRDLPSEKVLPPRGGWISAIRKSLGISGSVLAQRMGISQSAEAQFEKSEKERNITLQTLEKVAAACERVRLREAQNSAPKVHSIVAQGKEVAARTTPPWGLTIDVEESPERAI